MTNNTNNLNNVTFNLDLFNNKPYIHPADVLTKKDDKVREALSRYILNPDHRPEGMDILEIRYLFISPVLGSIVPSVLRIAATEKDIHNGFYSATGYIHYFLIEWEAMQLKADESFHCEGNIYDTFDVRFVDIWNVLPDGTYELSWDVTDVGYIPIFIEDLLKKVYKEITPEMSEGLDEFSKELNKLWKPGEDLTNSETWQRLVMEYWM